MIKSTTSGADLISFARTAYMSISLALKATYCLGCKGEPYIFPTQVKHLSLVMHGHHFSQGIGETVLCHDFPLTNSLFDCQCCSGFFQDVITPLQELIVGCGITETAIFSSFFISSKVSDCSLFPHFIKSDPELRHLVSSVLPTFSMIDIITRMGEALPKPVPFTKR
jgi:hypothetical protein